MSLRKPRTPFLAALAVALAAYWLAAPAPVDAFSEGVRGLAVFLVSIGSGALLGGPLFHFAERSDGRA